MALGPMLPGQTLEEVKGKKSALLVGVTEYDSSKFTTLKFTDNDVEELAKVLEKPILEHREKICHAILRRADQRTVCVALLADAGAMLLGRGACPEQGVGKAVQIDLSPTIEVHRATDR